MPWTWKSVYTHTLQERLMGRLGKHWTGRRPSTSVAGKKENLSSSLMSATRTNDSHVKFYCVLPCLTPTNAHQSEGQITACHWHQHPPTAGVKGKVPEEAGEDKMPLPLCTQGVANAGSNLATNTPEMGHFVLYSLFQRSKWKLDLYPE